jgi:putative oxidoreductase
MPNLDSWSPRILSLLRIVAGLLFMEHGLQKIFHFPAPLPPPPAVAAAAAAVGHAVSHGLPPMIQGAGWIEIIGGLLITLGLFGRVAAFICSGEMAFAYFMSHFPKSFYPVNNGGDLAILFCFVFFFFVFAGPGPVSLDAILRKKP